MNQTDALMQGQTGSASGEDEPVGQASQPDLWSVLSSSLDARDFMQAWLTLTCASAPGARQAVAFVREPGRAVTSPVARWVRPGALGDPQKFAKAAQRLLTQPDASKDGAYERGEDGACHAALGFWFHDEPVGGLVVETDPLNGDAAHRLLRHLQWSRAWVEAFFHRTDEVGRADITARARSLLDMVATITPHTRFADASRVFAGALQTDLKADRVAVGFLRKHRCTIEALAQAASFEKSMQLLQYVGLAMDEAVDQHASLLFTRSGHEDQVRSRALMKLAEQGGMHSVLVVPMPLGGDIIGAVSIERADQTPFTQDDIDLADALVTSAAPILVDKKERSRSSLSLVGERFVRGLGWMIGPRALGWKLAGLVVTGGILASLLLTTEHRIAADTVVQGEIRRVLTAPFDGYVDAANARAGELINEGDVLAELDDSDLQLDRLRLTARKQQHQLELDRATADQDLAQINILRAQIAQDDAELRLVEDQLSRTQIVAPFDGVLVSGDLSQTIGQPVSRGDLLFELAPLERYRIIALVKEGDVHLLEPGVSGRILLAALPEEPFSFTVDTVTPIARAEEGVNGFDVIGSLSDPTGRVRPGMEGVARIDAGERSYAYIWGRGLVEWLRLKLWSLWP